MSVFSLIEGDVSTPGDDSVGNSSTANLASGATFTGVFEDVGDHAAVIVNAFADVASAAGGLKVQWSSNGTAAEGALEETATLAAGVAQSLSCAPRARYVRVQLVNGGSNQTALRLKTLYRRAGDAGAILSWLGSRAPTVGQKTMVSSIPVVLPSDQTVAVVTAPSNATSGFTQGDVQTAAIAQVAVRRTAYVEQSANAQRSVQSASANDSSAGTGIRTLRITYYTATFTGPFTTDVTMSGTTPVNTSVSDICFVEKMEGLAAGGLGVGAGVISLKAAAGGGGATIGSIAAGDTQTYWAHHYVPTGKTAHVSSQWAGHNGTTVGSGASTVIKALRLGVAGAIEQQVSDNFRLYGQSSSVQRNYGNPIRVPGPARLTTYIFPETSTSTNYRASFDYYEVDT